MQCGEFIAGEITKIPRKRYSFLSFAVMEVYLVVVAFFSVVIYQLLFFHLTCPNLYFITIFLSSKA